VAARVLGGLVHQSGGKVKFGGVRRVFGGVVLPVVKLVAARALLLPGRGGGVMERAIAGAQHWRWQWWSESSSVALV
jgi:hypothetical protein